MERFLPVTSFSAFNMKQFNDYISEAEIISCLVRFRARKAKERDKRNVIYRLSSHPKYNIHALPAIEMDIELAKLLPSRRKWLKLGKEARYRNGQLLTTIDKNKLMIKNTIRRYQLKKPNEPFVQNLEKFILDIRNSCSDPNYAFQKPTILPKLKEIRNFTGNECRPIADYCLKDKIIIGLTNKFLTDLFDGYFSDCSYAFRSKIIEQGKVPVTLTHHSALQVLKEYKDRHEGKRLYVAECDIQKFYDSVNHSKIKEAFKRLLNKVKRENPGLYSFEAERLFYKYLDSYTFNKNVLTLNGDDDYFKKHRAHPGEFKWVEKEFLRKGFYKSFKNAKIGAPQGGALSGLITNIVLDYVDRKVLKGRDKDLLYVRYCDDMLIIHPDKNICMEAFKDYRNALTKLKLVPHEPRVIKEQKDFWKSKTKPPYLWSTSIGGRPWIGFVGYEVHFNGHVRVRKKSLEKELLKQENVVKRVLHSVEGGHNKVSPKAIVESVTNTLIGMSVGRARLWNYKDYPSKLCWADGFRELEENKYSAIQLKRLDRSRNRLIGRLKWKLRNIPLGPVKSIKDESKKQIMYYGKPFSYYYHVIEKNVFKNPFCCLG